MTPTQAAFLQGAAASAGMPRLGLDASPNVVSLSDAQLDARRDRLLLELAAVQDEQQRRGRTRSHRIAAQRQAAAAQADALHRPLDASDDAYPF